MIGLLQRVVEARVQIKGEITAAIGSGLLVLVGIRPTDTEISAIALLTRLLHYRIFSDSAGRMNHSLSETQGELLLVPQFTLAVDTRKGLRPGFSGAAPPLQACLLFEFLVAQAQAQAQAKGRQGSVKSGIFGANMQISLTNDGPVTFWLETD